MFRSTLVGLVVIAILGGLGAGPGRAPLAHATPRAAKKGASLPVAKLKEVWEDKFFNNEYNTPYIPLRGAALKSYRAFVREWNGDYRPSVVKLSIDAGDPLARAVNRTFGLYMQTDGWMRLEVYNRKTQRLICRGFCSESGEFEWKTLK